MCIPAVLRKNYPSPPSPLPLTDESSVLFPRKHYRIIKFLLSTYTHGLHVSNYLYLILESGSIPQPQINSVCPGLWSPNEDNESICNCSHSGCLPSQTLSLMRLSIVSHVPSLGHMVYSRLFCSGLSLSITNIEAEPALLFLL